MADDRTSLDVGLYNGQRYEMELDWLPCRALNMGTRGMREAGEVFTPRTARERKHPHLYDERLKVSCLYNVYSETVHRIAALPFERPPTITGELPDRLRPILSNADRMGTSLSVFASLIYQDAIDRGVGLFLVDNVPTTIVRGMEEGEDGEVRPIVSTMTLSEADAYDARPYFVRIEPDNLVGFRTQTVAGRETCVELRVREWAYQPGPSGRDELVERIRRWDTENVELWERRYSSTVLQEDRRRLAGRGDTTGWEMIEGPTPHGFPGQEIPIVAVYTRKRGYLHASPPFLDLAYLNIRHWNQQSQLDASLRYNQSPILFGKGLERETVDTPPTVGEGATMMTTSDQAQLAYVEISGASLTLAQREIEKTEARMRAAAVEPLMAGSATATGEMRAELKDQSEAQRWIEACEWALYRAFQIAHEWIGAPVDPEFNVTLHRASSLMQVANPARSQALQADAREGRLTLLTYLKERARSGDFADDFDPEAEAEAVEMDAERKVQRQMEALAGQMIAGRGESEVGDEEDGEAETVPPQFAQEEEDDEQEQS